MNGVCARIQLLPVQSLIDGKRLVSATSRAGIHAFSLFGIFGVHKCKLLFFLLLWLVTFFFLRFKFPINVSTYKIKITQK